MKTIPLGVNRGDTKTCCYFAVVDDEDYEYLTKYRWNKSKALKKPTIYANGKVSIEGGSTRTVLMHRLIMGCVDRDDLIIDHKDGNGLNNTRANLRFATHQENAQNRRCRNPLGVIGVAFVKGRYRAAITVNGKANFLGSFETLEEAARRRDIASVQYFGEFAKLNFPE